MVKYDMLYGLLTGMTSNALVTCAQAATWREEEDGNMEEKKEASKDAQVRKKERKRGRGRGRGRGRQEDRKKERKRGEKEVIVFV